MTHSTTIHEDNRATGLKWLLKSVWKYNLSFVLPIILATVLGIIITLYSARRAAVDVFDYPIQFNFSGVEKLQYPNGESFNLQDIIAPHVLDAVYESEIASKFDISAQNFREGFNISAYSPTRQLIIARYDNLLSNRRISFAESAAAGQELEAALNAASRNAAVITFQNSQLNLPPAVVQSSLIKVVQAWIRYSIDKRGVLELNVDVLEPSFLSESAISGLGQVSRLGSIADMYNKVAQYVSTLSKLEGAGALVDQQTGFTLSSMEIQLSSLEGRVVDLARRWSQTSSVTGTSLDGLLSSNAFDPAALSGLDPQVAFDLLIDRINDIRTNIALIEKIPQGASIPDTESGLTITDLRNILSEIEVYQIKTIRDTFLKSGVSQNPVAVRAYYEQRIREYQRKHEAILALAKVIEDVDRRYDNAQSVNAGPSTSTESFGGQQNPSVIPQFGDGFLDRIIGMSSQVDNTKFRQELARKSIELLEEASEIASRIEGLSSDLKIFEAGRADQSAAGFTFSQDDAKQQIDTVLKSVNGYLDVTANIGRRIKNSDDLIKILVEQLNLNEDDPRLSRNAFLSTDEVTPIEVADVLKPLQEIVTVANRINALLGETLYGARSLATSVAQPTLVRQPLIDRKSLLLFGIFVFLGVFIGVILTSYKILQDGGFGDNAGHA